MGGQQKKSNLPENVTSGHHLQRINSSRSSGAKNSLLFPLDSSYFSLHFGRATVDANVVNASLNVSIPNTCFFERTSVRSYVPILSQSLETFLVVSKFNGIEFTIH